MTKKESLKSPKKLIIFIGSPRKQSNSAQLAREAGRGARAAGAQVELVNLAQLNIRPCQACDRCRNLGPGSCFQRDDMQKLYPLLLQPAPFILSHPVYWFSINSQTKLFIDRWYALGTDEYACFKNKKVGIILTYAEADVFSSGGVNALHAYQDMFNYLGAEIKGLVYASAPDTGSVKANRQALKEAFELGKSLVS
ncbi:MAG: flavodoxin family protein [Candidatus Aminicenantes bacterium]|nr:flavodoxin family protein [Candidatus Aminicenantes bacterium]